MRSSFTADRGLKLARTPSVREQAQRRRLGILVAIASLALASGVFGALTAPHGDRVAGEAATGPFSYFPSE
ncbi:MAG: hypothetical protein JF588_17545 [Caulobacterales bacterium]|nr:hypothetical protein [Caulobacterales bacterium]